MGKGPREEGNKGTNEVTDERQRLNGSLVEKVKVVNNGFFDLPLCYRVRC